jgi:hypothetical protein
VLDRIRCAWQSEIICFYRGNVNVWTNYAKIFVKTKLSEIPIEVNEISHFCENIKKAFSFQSYFSPVGGPAELLYKVSFQHTIESNKIDFTFNFLSESLFFAIKMNFSFFVMYGINAGLNYWFTY